MHALTVEAYWARRTSQYIALEAAYTQKDLNMSIRIEVDKAVMSISMQETERKGKKESECRGKEVPEKEKGRRRGRRR